MEGIKREDAEQVCGACCHFKCEDIYGCGICAILTNDRPDTSGFCRCSDECLCGGYASEEFKRHQMAVLRQCQRCLHLNIGTEQALDVEAVCIAIDFLVDYAKLY